MSWYLTGSYETIIEPLEIFQLRLTHWVPVLPLNSKSIDWFLDEGNTGI